MCRVLREVSYTRELMPSPQQVCKAGTIALPVLQMKKWSHTDNVLNTQKPEWRGHGKLTCEQAVSSPR